MSATERKPTSMPVVIAFGLVNELFHLEHVATLIGFLFLCHQIGAFLSAWLGGLLLDATGGYTAIWTIDIAVCAFASIMSSRIKRGAHGATAGN